MHDFYFVILESSILFLYIIFRHVLENAKSFNLVFNVCNFNLDHIWIKPMITEFHFVTNVNSKLKRQKKLKNILQKTKDCAHLQVIFLISDLNFMSQNYDTFFVLRHKLSTLRYQITVPYGITVSPRPFQKFELPYHIK